MKNILVVFGTRPEAIKMAPLVRALSKKDSLFNVKVCVTAQHRQMLDQVLEFFEIIPDYDLNLMKPGQNLYRLTADIVTGMKAILEETKPDYIFVHGDTTTSTAVALAGFYHGSKVCHVEAGLRTFNKQSPWPEEVNRQLTGRIADFHFAPTETSKQNLLSEGINKDTILVTGNTVIDALFYAVGRVREFPPEITDVAFFNFISSVTTDKDIVLVTGHRRENHGQGFLNICDALKKISKITNAHIVFPVHLNPNVQKPVYEILGECANITLIEPLDYKGFAWLMDKAKIIITDSGGVQEEAPSLGKPVLVMRDTTERPEAVDAGTVTLVGTDTEKIVNEAVSLLTDDARYQRVSHLHNPYGDGEACRRIVEFMTQLLP
mgnify:CR=1 FL=1